jgi:hypothetical protein
MRRRTVLGAAVCLAVLAAASAYALWQHWPESTPTTGPEPGEAVPRSAQGRLPETPPPPGLPIIPWGKRDHFPVIRQPEYVSAEEGDRLLTPDEPVLGLVVGGAARAYSTNQLNEHEMVLDEVAGVPLLVTY